MTKQVTLTIDDRTVTVPEGTLIVDAAKKVGINIPVFCYHPKMEPVGMCRMCLVEIGRPIFDRQTREPVLDEDGNQKVQFGPKLETACTVPVSEGMVVVGMSEHVKKARKDILEFILTSHPLDCPICDKGGECSLQNLTVAYGASESRFLLEEKQRAEKHYPLGYLIFLDRERCIQCARCIRFQDEIAGDPVLAFFHRARRTDIVTFSEPGFDSYWSGNTTDICPVGALTTADFRFGARPWELKSVASICSHCAVGCNLTIDVRREVKSGGGLTIKRVMPRQNEWLNEIWICDKGRFTHHFTESEKRLEKPLIHRAGEWNPETWENALSLLTQQLKNIRGGLQIITSGRLPNEDQFNLRKLAEGLGGEIGLYSHMAGGDLVTQYGLGSESNLADLGKGDIILVVASDLEEEAPIWYLRLKAAAERGAKLIVANPRPTKLDRYASERIRYNYGKEIETLKKINLTEARNAIIFFGYEGMDLAGSEAFSNACASVLITTGHVNKTNNGLVAVWPRANDQGAWDMGLRPIPDINRAIQTPQVLYIVAADPAGDDPAMKELLADRSKHPEKITIVQELFLTETAELADIVLPAQAHTEREGTFTSGERRLQRFYPVTYPRGEAKADFDIAAEIGKRLGLSLKGRFPSMVFSQLSEEIPGYKGLTYQKLAEVCDQWPIIGQEDLYYGGTTYANKQGLGVKLQPLGGEGVQELQTPALPQGDLIAIPITKLYDHGTMMIPSEVIRSHLTKPFIALNPTDAQVQKATDGMTVNIGVNGDLAPVIVIIDDNVPTGFALVPRSCGIPIPKPTRIKIRIAETFET